MEFDCCIFLQIGQRNRICSRTNTHVCQVLKLQWDSMHSVHVCRMECMLTLTFTSFELPGLPCPSVTVNSCSLQAKHRHEPSVSGHSLVHVSACKCTPMLTYTTGTVCSTSDSINSHGSFLPDGSPTILISVVCHHIHVRSPQLKLSFPVDDGREGSTDEKRTIGVALYTTTRCRIGT